MVVLTHPQIQPAADRPSSRDDGTASPPVTQPLPDKAEASPVPRRFTADEYHRMAEAGVFGSDERVELLDGVVYEMSPALPPHSGAANDVADIFRDLQGKPPRWRVRVQSPVRLPGDNEPEPDVVLVRPQPRGHYRRVHPEPADIILLIEIALSSLESDRRFKAPRYARAGVVEFWIVNLVENVVEVHRQPEPAASRYQAPVLVIQPGDTLSPAMFPDATVAVADLLDAAAP